MLHCKYTTKYVPIAKRSKARKAKKQRNKLLLQLTVIAFIFVSYAIAGTMDYNTHIQYTAQQHSN